MKSVQNKRSNIEQLTEKKNNEKFERLNVKITQAAKRKL